MHGFDPEQSDIDILIVLSRALGDRERAALGRVLLARSNTPHPIEISAVQQALLDNWRHPCPHEFHYGEAHRHEFLQAEYVPSRGVDEDLAAHITVARARGIDLLGTFPRQRLPEVPRRDFLASLYADMLWAAKQHEDLSSYLHANACRTLAFLTEGKILSKTEGAQWCELNDVDTSDIVPVMRERLAAEVVV